MGLFSKIKDIGTSFGTLTKLCDKTWDLIGPDKVTYIFKSNKQVRCIYNGRSSVVPYEFFPDSKTLIIYEGGKSGTSYHLKYLDENALFLINEEIQIDLCFRNRNSSIRLDSDADVYRLCFIDQFSYIMERKRQMMEYHAIEDVDLATSGLDDDDVIRCIDAFREHIPEFDAEYTFYLEKYKKQHFDDYEGSFADRLITSIISSSSDSYYLERVRNPKQSKAIDLYIERKENL